LPLSKPVGAIDFDTLSKRTSFSGADQKAVVDGCRRKLGDAMRAGTLQPPPADPLESIKLHKPTVRDWFQTARNHALYANQSGL
jgi:hypothetical protein